MQFNKTIKSALKKKGIYQRKMSQDLEINEGQLSDYLKHNRRMSFDNITRMLDYLDISLKIGEKTP